MADQTSPRREVFSTRIAFLLAAIGSAVGLGNIWRFPYVAYDNGGGAFLVPYMIALLTAGIPLLFLDYSLGHRFRGSAPLVFRRIRSWAEPVGWIQVGIAFFITIYYAAIIGWAGLYTVKSFNKAWGDMPEDYFMKDFLQADTSQTVSTEIVPQIAIALALVWVLAIIVMAMGVDEGIGKISKVFMPLLTVLFIIVVIQALFLDGAAEGLNAFFTPNWDALRNPTVWVAAYGQIFFSLSVGFGIMLTYSSYLKRRTDLTGSGLVVGFANSGFELLAGIGVFAALGFMANQAGLGVSDVAGQGLTLAFVAFPTIISQAPFGSLMGVLFFASLTVAGLTSLLSIVEVVVSAVRDKLGIPKVRATLAIGIPLAIISTALLSTTTALYFLDITDEFVNKFGILAVAFACVIAVAWIVRKLPVLSRHLDRFSSFRTGKAWVVFIGAIVPVALGSMLVTEFLDKIGKPYENYPLSLLAVFGWGMAAVLIVAAVVLTLIPWRRSITTDFDEHDNEHEVSE